MKMLIRRIQCAVNSVRIKFKMWQFVLFGTAFSLSSYYSYYFYYYFRYADYLSGKDCQTIHTLEELGLLIAGFIYIFLLDGLIFRSRRLVNILLMIALANMGVKMCLVFNTLRLQANGILQLKNAEYPLVFPILLVLDVITLGVAFPRPLLFRMASSRTPMLMEHLVILIMLYKHMTLLFTSVTNKITLELIYTRLKIMIVILLVLALVNNFGSVLRYEVEHLVMRILGIEYLWIVNDESEIEDISSQILVQLSQPVRELLRNNDDLYTLPSALEATAPPPPPPLPQPSFETDVITPPRHFSDELPLPPLPTANEIERGVISADNIIIQTASNLNMFKDKDVKLPELMRQFSQRYTNENHMLNFTNYALHQEYISKRLLHIARQLEEMSESFNKYLILLVVLTHYFEWIFNERHATTIPVEDYGHYTITTIAYCVGTFLNMAIFRNTDSVFMFWGSYFMICIMLIRNCLDLYTNYVIVPYIICGLYPGIIINLLRIYFANLRIYVHPDHKLRFRIEKFLIFYGYNLMSVISAYFILKHLDLYVNYIIMGSSAAVVATLLVILVKKYYVLLNVVYRSTTKNLFKVSS